MTQAVAVVGACFPLKPGTKEPAISAWQVVGPGVYPASGSYGIALTAADLVADGDPRNYPAGRDVLQELLSAFPGCLPTRVVKTPRGGYHVYMKKPNHLKFKKHQSKYPGIDFLSEGHYVCGPGTITVETPNSAAGIYQSINDNPIGDAPQALLDDLEVYADRLDNGAEMTLAHSKTFKDLCAVQPSVARGSRGIETYKLALQGRDLGLPKDVVYEHVRDQWNVRNSPPESDSELYKSVEHAFRYAKNAVGVKTPEAKFTPNMAPTEPVNIPDNVVSVADFQHKKVETTVHQQCLTLDPKKGTIEPTQANCVYLLRHDPAWSGRLVYNQFADRIELKGKPDWRRNCANKDEAITNYDFAFMQAWFSSAHKLERGIDMIKNACFAAARPYHPVLDWLDGLPEWDGKPRLDTLLLDTAGLAPEDDNEYTRAVSACVVISIIKRVREPGSKQDYVMVMESKQGRGKSTWVEELGRPWASTGELVPGDKDTYQNLRGKLVVELPEINATFSKADHAWLKKVLSTASDNYRKSYGHVAETVPRESIFIATINPNASGEYLKDDENRRYWPVRVGVKKFNIQLLKDTRDQIFAEAQQRYRAGERPWITAHGAAEIARAEQAKRRETDPWVDVLASWLANREKFNTTEVYLALGLSAKEVNSRQRTRVYTALREMGWDFDRAMKGGEWTKIKRLEDLI